jgi:inorganic pyrophosphatase
VVWWWVGQVRPLGVLAMIDEGELDWKLIVINVVRRTAPA